MRYHLSSSSHHKLKILITGVSGFVGRQLATRFLEQGHSVIGVDLRVSDLEFERHANFSVIAADLTKPNAASELPWDDVDLLYHLAAAGVKAATRQWPLCVQVNVIGTASLMAALLERVQADLSVPRIVYTKSYYEDHLDAIPAFKENAYVVSKVAATKWLEAIAPIYPQSICIAKVYQVYGPGDDPNNVLSYAARQLKAGEPASFGSGKSMRDWIYIDDFIAGLEACGQVGEPGLHHYDLGSGERRSIREMVETIAKIAGASPELLAFDPAKDRGDAEIEDWAVQLPPRWHIQNDTIAGLSKLLSSI
jgi:nucleoside-diphosphate-sugar epimerase